MKLFRIELAPIFTLCLLLLPITATSYDFNPFDKSLPEGRELNEFYRYPMLAIDGFLHGAEQYCNRLPSEKEFRNFILNGRHKFLRCSQIIKAAIPLQRTGHHVGKDLPYLPDFLKRDQYQVYSDTKNFFIILKHNPSEWKYKYFKSDEYEFAIHCKFGLAKCSFSKIKSWASSCRASETFAQNHCYFNGKKIIDY